MAKATPKKPAAKKLVAKKLVAKKPVAKKPVAKEKAKPAASRRGPDGPVLRSVRSVIFQVDDLDKAKAFYSAALGRTPYFDQPFYAGYNVDGQELGLHPDVSKLRPGAGGAIAYWNVDSILKSWDYLLSLGGRAVEAPHDVGGDIKTAIIADPFGNLVGLIQIAT